MSKKRTDPDTDDEIVSAYIGGHSALSIAETFDLSLHLVLDRLRKAKVRIRRTNREPVPALNLGATQHERLVEIIDGLLLGDGSISQPGVLRLGQSIIHEEWVRQVQVWLKQTGVDARIGNQPARVCKIGEHLAVGKGSVFVYTRVFAEFKQQRARWYPVGKKRIPNDVRLTPYSLALWLCGDGSNRQGGLLSFSTNGFLRTDLDHLIARMRQEFGIHMFKCRSGRTVSGRQTFHLVVGRRDDCCIIKSLVEPFVPSVFAYKLHDIRPAIPRGRALRQFDDDQIRAIRQRHANGETATGLGRVFGVSNVTIANIVEQKIYREIQ
jgi:hypothetical protein